MTFETDELVKRYRDRIHHFRYSEVPIYEPWLERLKVFEVEGEPK